MEERVNPENVQCIKERRKAAKAEGKIINPKKCEFGLGRAGLFKNGQRKVQRCWKLVLLFYALKP